MARQKYILGILAVFAVAVTAAALTPRQEAAGHRPHALARAPRSASAGAARGASARAASVRLCQEQTARVSGGTYIVQNNEFDSSAPECVSTGGTAGFAVATSAIANATNGSPGAYAAIYQGCHWGNCSSGGLSAMPIEVSGLTAGKVRTSWSTTQPGGRQAYDVAYDIWFNQAPTTSGQPDCTELMVWLNHNGTVQPFGSRIATGVSVGGHSYDIWTGSQSWGNSISYDMTAGATSVAGLDVGTLAQDAVRRGYLSRSCYLIDVEAGFELWQGGTGLATSSFSVSISGSGPAPGASGPSPAPPSPSPSPASPSPGGVSPAPAASSPGRGSCSATYSLVNTWPGGFQGQVLVRSTGSGRLSSWRILWTFPGDQKISNLWNAGYVQSGATVAVSNAAYNGALAPGGTVTVGFTGTQTAGGSSPLSLSCS